MNTENVSYSTYLHLHELLSLQKLQSEPPTHSETLFIITHQAYELWFKQLLHEVEKIKVDFKQNNLPEAIHIFKRICAIMKVLLEQIDIIETITPLEFFSLRNMLKTASGFQSLQYWELEFTLGNKRSEIIKHQRDNVTRLQLEQVLHKPSIYSYFYDFLEHREIVIPKELREREHSLPPIPHQTIQDGLVKLYTEAFEVGILLELMLDFDFSFQQWRYRHAKLAERTIGYVPGTAKTTGVPYLMQYVSNSFFPDLLACRSQFYNQ
jgi:tryptophan 2,3-dioxygenase